MEYGILIEVIRFMNNKNEFIEDIRKIGIGTIILYLCGVYFFIQFVLVPEEIQINIPLKLFYSMLVLVFIGVANISRNMK